MGLFKKKKEPRTIKVYKIICTCKTVDGEAHTYSKLGWFDPDVVASPYRTLLLYVSEEEFIKDDDMTFYPFSNVISIKFDFSDVGYVEPQMYTCLYTSEEIIKKDT